MNSPSLCEAHLRGLRGRGLDGRVSRQDMRGCFVAKSALRKNKDMAH
jgi:hypothetical protein